MERWYNIFLLVLCGHHLQQDLGFLSIPKRTKLRQSKPRGNTDDRPVQSNNPFPQRLHQARTEAGISQKDLGLRIGMEPSSASSRMNHYEKGRHMPDYETLERLAKELDKPVAYFFCDKESLAELVCLLDTLSEDQRQALISEVSTRFFRSNK